MSGVLLLLVAGLLAYSVAVGPQQQVADGRSSTTPSASISVQPSRTPYPSDAPGTHTVRSWETLYSIAHSLGVSEEQLRYWNYDTYPSLRSAPRTIRVGWVLITEGPTLPTPTPRPTRQPTPVPTVPPVIGGGGTGGGGGGSGGDRSTPYDALTANAYKADVELTYVNDMQRARFMLAIAATVCLPGMTIEECAGRVREQELQAAFLIATSINLHFQFMNSNRPSTCFADAYQADISVGQAFYDAAVWIREHDEDASGLLASAFDKRDAFLAEIDGHFRDCK